MQIHQNTLEYYQINNELSLFYLKINRQHLKSE